MEIETHRLCLGMVGETSTNGVNKVIEDTIDNVLSVLGDTCKSRVYALLEIEYGLGRDDFAHSPFEFSSALSDVFGGGAALLEIEIMRQLSGKFPEFRHSPKGKLLFPEYVKALFRFVGKAPRRILETK